MVIRWYQFRRPTTNKTKNANLVTLLPHRPITPKVSIKMETRRFGSLNVHNIDYRSMGLKGEQSFSYELLDWDLKMD